MANQIQKADKLVTSATTVFNAAIDKVEKANNLLLLSIEKDAIAIESKAAQIEKLKEEIKETESSKSTKALRFEENNSLIQKLQEFSSK